MHRILVVAAAAALALGLGSLALTLYLWFGDWPAEVKDVVDYARSVAASEAQPPDPLVANVPGRRVTSLNGTWKALVDPNRAGLSPITIGMIPRNVRPESTSDLVEFSFDDGLVLRVPGDWNTQDDRLLFYRGLVWYQREFEHARRPGRRVYLHFGAANYRSSVFLNGRRIGGHVGGFTPFNLDVTGALRDGSNLLVVAVDNEAGPHDVPTPLTDWWNYGGITRDVSLVDLPETFIRSYHVQLAPGEPDRIRGWIALDGPDAAQELTLSIPELAVQAELHSDRAGRAEIDVSARPEPWSPGSPRLYRVEIRSETDAVAEQIGFRTFQAVGKELLLNGRPVFLRGVSLHEEAPFGGGRISTREDAEILLGWARELGANFVRLAHYPHDESLVRAADRMGLLVWSEIPVYWNVAFGEPRTLVQTRQQLSEMIERDRNRASVALWSIANETPISEERNAFMRSLADHARILDPTRPVTAALLTGVAEFVPLLARNALPASLGASPELWAMRVDDPLGEIVDVPAVNQYFGWYYAAALGKGTPLSMRSARRIVLDNLDRLRIQLEVDKPVIVSEFGAGAKQGFHAPEEELAVFSEEYQALVYRRQLEMLAKQPDVRGISPWVLKDFRSPMRMLQGVQDYRNLKGLVSDDGRRKLAFDVLRAHYEGLAATAAALP
jgi:beta-glucuronidase